MDFYKSTAPYISGNSKLRHPQSEGFKALKNNYENLDSDEREFSIILPVGCGKSGLISITPFAYKSKRTLVIAPGLKIAEQLHADVDPTSEANFYRMCDILKGAEFPEPVEIRGTTTNISDLNEADIVVTNIHQLQGANNKWLEKMDESYFDLILFDEGHHSVAESWNLLREKFPKAQIVNYSATPRRSDGQVMSGQVVYSFPVVRAIKEGYVKKINALCLNPKTLKYVREEDGVETEVTLSEVISLGESDADFRRSIVTSKLTLGTIVDASINELRKLRNETGEKRLKIIATALNQKHCIQVVQAYEEKGLNADYVHSNLEGKANERIMQKLESHELDVIVQVRKLGEGFNHKFLSVAAVFNVFRSLSPFVQFVGRIMRVIEQNSPGHALNKGTVIYHAGANIARLWDDFKEFSEADQEYFDQLLPEEGLEFNDGDDLIEVSPDEEVISREINGNRVSIKGQDGVHLEELHLWEEDAEVMKALSLLKSKGMTGEQLKKLYEHQELPVSKVKQRQAKRASLDDLVKNAAGSIIKKRGMNPGGMGLDKAKIGKTNFVAIKSAIDKKINEFLGRSKGERSEFSAEELQKIENNFEILVGDTEKELF